MPQVFRNGEWIDVAYVPPEQWPLPPPASLLWRLPIVRHLRWLVLNSRVGTWNSVWLSVGYFPNGYDERVLNAVWRGEV